MANKRRRVDPIKWPGAYQYELKATKGKPDLAYYISYKDGTKKIWEKVGKKSEGMTPQVADDIRKERTLAARHGEKVLKASISSDKRRLLTGPWMKSQTPILNSAAVKRCGANTIDTVMTSTSPLPLEKNQWQPLPFWTSSVLKTI